MPKIVKPLTDTQIRNQKPREKDFVLSDGKGLQLRVRANGSKLWNFNYYHPDSGKRVNIGIGPYPEVSLAKAREKAMTFRQGLVDDIDPKEERERELFKKKKAAQYTLINVAKEWLDWKKVEITEDHATKTWRSLERHVFPTLGDTPLEKITAHDVKVTLKPVEAAGNLETVKRLRQRLTEIMNFGLGSGYVKANPLTDTHLIFRKPTKQKMLSIDPTELPTLMHTLSHASIKRVTRCLIEWQLHTMTRPSEAATARWDELDLGMVRISP